MPYMHLCFVPLTSDNRLSVKEVMGDRNKLAEWQDKFHDYMAEEFPELERGQAAAITKRKHIPTWLYKQSHRLTNEMRDIRREIKNISTLNAGKQREKILKLLTQWYPKVNAFEAKLKPYDEQFRIMEAQASDLQAEVAQARWERDLERREGLSLIEELREYQDFIASILEELFEELKKRYELGQQEQMQHHQQNLG